MAKFDINYIYIICTILVIAVFISLFAIVVTTPSAVSEQGVPSEKIQIGEPSAATISPSMMPPESRPTFIHTPIAIYNATSSPELEGAPTMNVSAVSIGVPGSAPMSSNLPMPSSGPVGKYTGKRLIQAGQAGQVKPAGISQNTKPAFNYEYQQGSSVAAAQQASNVNAPVMQKQVQNVKPTLVNPAITRKVYKTVSQH